MSKSLKYIIGITAAVLLCYLSLDIRDLEKYRATTGPVVKNATDYATEFWNNTLPLCITSATELGSLLELLNDSPESAFQKYGRKLGISGTYYFMVRDKGIIDRIEAEYIVVNLDDQKKIKIAIDFIFGNAVRDGSGKVNINDFTNMTDFNDVSVAINKLVKENVVKPLRDSAMTGRTLEFAGAMEISEGNVDLSEVVLIPVSIKFSDGKTE